MKALSLKSTQLDEHAMSVLSRLLAERCESKLLNRGPFLGPPDTTVLLGNLPELGLNGERYDRTDLVRV